MSIEFIGIIGLVIMLLLMFLQMHLGVCMAIVGFAGFSYIAGMEGGLSMLSLTAHRTASNYVMTCVPLFILMGILAARAGLSEDSFYAANKWVGHLPGGLAMATVGGCAAFGAVCGSAVATAATMCTVSLPQMRRHNYADELSLGAIASGGLLGWMIPPSLPFMLYGVLTEISIGRLFIAGIMPGILTTLLFVVAIYIVCRLNPRYGPVAPKSSWRERIKSLYKVWGILVLFILVMGGMYGGVFSPTEGGAIGAFGALVLSLAKRGLTRKNFAASLYETAHLTGMIFLLIIGAMVFSYFMSVTEIPFALANLIAGLSMPPLVIVLAILIVYVILGFFMDIMSIVVLSVPILYPILTVLGIDPVWFGVMVVLTVMIGNITPPVGVLVYTVAGMVKEVPVYTIFRGVWPFFYAQLAALIILLFFPQISLWLPNMMIAG